MTNNIDEAIEAEAWVACQVGEAVAMITGKDSTIRAAVVEEGIRQLRERARNVWSEDFRVWRPTRRPRKNALAHHKTDLFEVLFACMNLGYDLSELLRGNLTKASIPRRLPGWLFTSYGWVQQADGSVGSSAIKNNSSQQ
ncbi:hypothetical protein PQR71_07815 [Paraburkholderia fungorum]|uniref:hypothetical protein n=1 Tax=Paraburkholderia fungorum TaxID=134537 RepID=UPI0038B7C486